MGMVFAVGVGGGWGLARYYIAGTIQSAATVFPGASLSSTSPADC